MPWLCSVQTQTCTSARPRQFFFTGGAINRQTAIFVAASPREKSNTVTALVKRCVTCQKNNDVPAATTPAAHTPAPPGPFRHLQVDYISLPPCKGKTDVLVVIDKFSRWVEAYPTGRATAAHTAKCLVTDFIPRWGFYPDANARCQWVSHQQHLLHTSTKKEQEQNTRAEKMNDSGMGGKNMT